MDVTSLRGVKESMVITKLKYCSVKMGSQLVY